MLDALRIALPWRANTGQSLPFGEYDYYMEKSGDTPQSSDGITIELTFCEDNPDDWPEAITQDLDNIIQTDPVKDLDCIVLRLRSKYDDKAKAFAAKWEFLNLEGQPLGGQGALAVNLNRFLAYIRCFYLSSMRDSNNEFSPRSRFWGRILRDLNIDEEQRKSFGEELVKLNERLLKADPRLEQVRTSLEKAQRIMESENEEKTSIQALPLKPWDLMSKSEVVIKARGGEIDFPLSCHGQEIQSMAVLFLFQAYIDVLLKPTFKPETEAILALEEPEAHLHPQATRTLASNLGKVQSQKIISSHSPYFIQEIPFEDIRMVRRRGASSTVLYVKRKFDCKIPLLKKLEDFCQHNAPKFSFDPTASVLSVRGKMEEREYRNLLKIYQAHPDVHPDLRQLKESSHLFIEDDELRKLETYVKRIRGEINDFEKRDGIRGKRPIPGGLGNPEPDPNGGCLLARWTYAGSRGSGFRKDQGPDVPDRAYPFRKPQRKFSDFGSHLHQ